MKAKTFLQELMEETQQCEHECESVRYRLASRLLSLVNDDAVITKDQIAGFHNMLGYKDCKNPETYAEILTVAIWINGLRE